MAPDGFMLDLDRCMLVEHRAGDGMKRPAKDFQMAAIFDGRQKYDLNRKKVIYSVQSYLSFNLI